MTALVEHGAHRILSGVDTSTSTGRSTGFSLSSAMKVIIRRTALAAVRRNYEVNADVSAVIVG